MQAHFCDHQRCCEAVRSAILATAWFLAGGGLVLRLYVQWFLYGNIFFKNLSHSLPGHVRWPTDHAKFSSRSYIVWSMGIPGMKNFGASGADPVWHECGLLLSDESRPQDAGAPLTDRSTSVGGDTYSDAFDTVSEDELVNDAKLVREARLLPSAKLGYTWTWHDRRICRLATLTLSRN